MHGHSSNRDLKICVHERLFGMFTIKNIIRITAVILQIKYYGRSEGGTVAVGVSSWHKIEAADVVKGPFTLVQ